MRPFIDLHIHSTFSDGTCSVTEICAIAAQNGVKTIALSDHDTTDGLAPMVRALEEVNRDRKRLSFIPAIEVSSGDNGLTHVLGYGVQAGQEPLQSQLVTLKRKRVERNAETIRLLNRLLDTELSPESTQNGVENPVLGRMHVARLLIENRFVKTVDEAFRKYLGIGKPAYIPLRNMSTDTAIDNLLQTGAVPVLAHPMRLGCDRADLEIRIAHLKEQGLMGVEVFHPSASAPDVKWLYRIAQKYALLITGGSDFHGDYGMHSKLGNYPAGWHTGEQDLDALQAAIKLSAISSEGDD